MTIRGVNRVTLIGEMGRDPDLRYAPDGTSVAAFPVATRQRWRSAAGEMRDVEEWFHVVVWGDLAERCTEELVAGDVVYVDGRLQTRSWEDEGRHHYLAEVAAQEVLHLANGPAEPVADEAATSYPGAPARPEIASEESTQ